MEFLEILLISVVSLFVLMIIAFLVAFASPSKGSDDEKAEPNLVLVYIAFGIAFLFVISFLTMWIVMVPNGLKIAIAGAVVWVVLRIVACAPSDRNFVMEWIAFIFGILLIIYGVVLTGVWMADASSHPLCTEQHNILIQGAYETHPEIYSCDNFY